MTRLTISGSELSGGFCEVNSLHREEATAAQTCREATSAVAVIKTVAACRCRSVRSAVCASDVCARRFAHAVLQGSEEAHGSCLLQIRVMVESGKTVRETVPRQNGLSQNGYGWWATPGLHRTLRNHEKVSNTVSGRVSGNAGVSEKVSGTFCDFPNKYRTCNKVFQIVFKVT